MSENKPKFQIGDVVYNNVERRGSYEPTICSKHTRLEIDKVERNNGGGFTYTCGYDGYKFTETELLSISEFVSLTMG